MALFTHTESLNKIWQEFITLSVSHFLWTRSHGLSCSLSLSLDAFTRSVSYLSSPLLSLFSLVSFSLSLVSLSLSLSLSLSVCIYLCNSRCNLVREFATDLCGEMLGGRGENQKKKLQKNLE